MFIIEKCSESTGNILTLYFFLYLFIKSQPQITDSLLAIRIFLLIFNDFKVGCKPAIPGIANIDTSDFLKLYLKYCSEFNILTLPLYFFFLFFGRYDYQK